MNTCYVLSRLGLAVVLLFAVGRSEGAAARGSEISLVAQLIWGTDAEKTTDKRLKELDRETLKRLKGVFRWKNYFEVERQEFSVAKAGRHRARLSSKCEIEVEHQGRSVIEVKLYGEGKLVMTKRQALKGGELLVLAGDDKNATAWFVILSVGKE
jgi:hypothetical protein